MTEKRVLYIGRRPNAAEEMDILAALAQQGDERAKFLGVSPRSAAAHLRLVKEHRPVLVLLPLYRPGSGTAPEFSPCGEALVAAPHMRFVYDPRTGRRLERYRAPRPNNGANPYYIEARPGT